MLKVIMAAGALALSGSGALAQAVSPTNTGSMSSMDTGTTPIAGQNEPAFVMAASDANLYQIKAAQLAVTKAQRDDVKAYAKIFDSCGVSSWYRYKQPQHNKRILVFFSKEINHFEIIFG